MKKSLGPLNRRIAPSAEALEPRHLYSADAIAFAPAGQAAQISILSTPAVTSEATQHEQSQQKPPELVVIDARVEQIDALTQDLTQQRANGREIEYLIVQSDQDALMGILAHLQNSSAQYSAIHLVGHGQAGHMQLGAHGINSASVSLAAPTIMEWSNYLTQTADIRLYGCDFASNSNAQSVLANLASLTGADVAASIDKTGHKDLGSNWILESTTGAQESTSPFTANLETTWVQQLADPIGNTAPLQISVPAAGTASNPVISSTSSANAIARNSSGQIMVVWSQNDPDNPSTTAAYAQFFDVNGAPTSGAIKVSRDNGTSEDQVTVAALANGTFLVAWRADADSSSTSIEAQIVSSTGGLLGNAITMSDPAAIDASRPTIATGLDGTWMLAYQERTGSVDGQDNTGDPMSPWRLTAILGHQDSQLTQRDYVDILFANHSISNAQLVWNSNQKYTIAAQINSNTVRFESDSGLRFIELTTDAANQNISVGDIELLNSISSLSQDNVAIARLDNGGWVAAFEDDSNLVSQIRIRYFSSTGVPLDTESFVAFDSGKQQTKPKISVDPVTDKVVVTWTSRPVFGTSYEILGRQFDQEGSAVGGAFEIGQSSTRITNGAVLFNNNAVYSLGTQNAPSNTLFAQRNQVVIGEVLVAPTATTVVEGQTLKIEFALSFAPTTSVSIQNAQLQTVATFSPSNWTTSQYVYLPIDLVPGDQGTRTENYTFTVVSNDPAYSDQSKVISYAVMEPWAQYELIVDTVSDIVDTQAIPTSVADLLLNKGADGKISLREAILAINNTNTPNAEPIRIRFNLGAQQDINLTSVLPIISKPIDIDGAYIGQDIGVHLNGIATSTSALLTLGMGAEGSKIMHIGLGNHGTGDYAHAILIQASQVTVDHIRIGTHPHSQAASPVAGAGIQVVEANGTIIRNSSIGHSLTGIFIERSTDTHIASNSIGMNLNVAAGNRNDGIHINNSSNSVIYDNEIGFNATGGIRIGGNLSTNNAIQNNAIGTNRTHELVATNSNAGIAIQAGANNNWIGGTGPSEGNYIAHSQFQGVIVFSESEVLVPFNNRIIGNQFSGNGERAISLTSSQENWVNKANDLGDSDQGPNEYLNSIVLVAASATTTALTVISDYNGLATSQFRVDFYESPRTQNNLASNDVGRWLGFDTFTTDATENVRVTSILNAVVSDATTITAIVTRIETATQTLLSSSADSNRITVVQNAQPIWSGSTNPSIAENSQQRVPISVSDPTTQRSLEPRLLNTFQGLLFELVEGSEGFFVQPRNALNFEAFQGHNGSNIYIVELEAQTLTGESSIQKLYISVLDVNEAALISINANGLFFEDQPILFSGQQRIQITVSEPDATQTLQRLTLSIDQGSLIRPADIANVTVRGFSNQSIELEAHSASLEQYLNTLRVDTEPNWSGTITFNVTLQDQTQQNLSESTSLTINVGAVNDAPELTTRNAQVLLGQTLTIGSQTLQVTDLDSEPSFIYTLVNAPRFGELSLNNVGLQKGSTFTQADLDSGQLTYQALSLGTGSDAMTLSALDRSGANSNQADLTISISEPVVARVIPRPVDTAPAEPAVPPPATQAGEATTEPMPSTEPASAGKRPATPTVAQSLLRPVSSLESQTTVAQNSITNGDSPAMRPEGSLSTALTTALTTAITTSTTTASNSTTDPTGNQATPSTSPSSNSNAMSAQSSGSTSQSGQSRPDTESRNFSREANDQGSVFKGTDTPTSLTHSTNQSSRDFKEGVNAPLTSDSFGRSQALAGNNAYHDTTKNSFAQLRATPSLSLTWERATVNQPSFTREIVRVQEDLQEPIKLDRAVVNSTVAVSTGVSIGYVIWMLRGGVLLSSLMASLPAWRTLDPLPVLSSLSGDDQKSDDDSLQSLLERAKKTLNKPEIKHAEATT